MRFTTYDHLPDQTRRVRERVFVDEQGFHDEFDDIDQLSWHLLAFAGTDEAIAASRFFPSGPVGEPLSQGRTGPAGTYTIGRVAVERAWRGHHVGAAVLRATEEAIVRLGGHRAILHAQEQAEGFYRKQGYEVCGERGLDEGCPHVWMGKDLPAVAAG
ncbi:GNAT family N-acetyltransferase [Bifidobacterium xylocopae]|nr:GNAT family N-acetyltransferase [Bifidobacterium xylocopae]